MVIERFPDAATYETAWGRAPTTTDDLVEQTLALEVESTLKSAAPLRWKLEKWNAALDLSVVHAVVWVVRSRAVADRLTELGVGRPGTAQLLVPSRVLGLDGEEFEWQAYDGGTWWPLRLPRATK